MDGNSNHICEQITLAFGKNVCLYAVLGITKGAGVTEVKKAYRKKALIHHPDRKGGDEEKFKALSAIHSVLSDEKKRKIYDQTGNLEDIDDDEGVSDNAQFWYDYYRTIFPKVTTDAIDEFSIKYKHSMEETTDIISAYNRYNGDINDIMDTVMLLEEGEEERVIDIIDNEIKSNNLEVFPMYIKYKNDILGSDTVGDSSSSKKRKKTVKKRKDVSLGNDDNDDSISSLAAMIASKNSSRTSIMSNIMSKYGGVGDDEYDISDEAFEKTKSKLGKSSSSTSSATASKKKGKK